MNSDWLAKREQFLLPLVILSTIACIVVSIWCLLSGYYIIFQNLFYIPIILACIFYNRRGFFYSCLLAFIYLGLIRWFSSDMTLLFQAGIRVVLFVGIAGVITFLVISGKKSEEKKQELSEFQNSIISSARVWLMVLDKKGTIHLWNTAAKEISGYSADEVIGKNTIWKSLYPKKEYRYQITNTINHIIQEKQFLENFETTILTRDGKEKIISWNTRDLIEKKGEISKYIAIGVDVSSQKTAERALQDQRRFLKDILDSLPVPVFYKNRAGVYTGCNVAFENVYGMTKKQVIGKTVYETWPKELADIYYQADQSIFTDPHMQQYEAFMKYADGLFHQVIFYKAPLFDDKNQVSGLVGAILDVTARKQAEERLKQIIQELEMILENVPAIIMFKDTENRYIKVNSATSRIFGRSVSEIEGKRFLELFPDQEDIFYPDDLEVIHSKQPRFGKIQKIPLKSGGYFWAKTDKVPLFGDDGEVIGILVVITDITEEKNAKDAITFANKKLNLLSSITRHDIGNQLQLIFGYLDLAEEDVTDPLIKKEIADANLAAHHIERQLAFSRDYEDVGVHSPVWQDVRTLIILASQPVDLSHIELENEISGVEIFADPLMEKVFYNLIDNARRYGDTITRIRFYGIEGTDSYSIVCEDNGVGIAEDLKVKIFNREYYKHTGFGLNLSREILSITGLTIVENGEPGKGARFEIRVPKEAYRITSKVSM